MSGIFISHSSRDREAAEAMAARLRRPLSRLRLHRPYGWLLRRAARRAQARAAACADGRCPVPEGEGAPPHP